MGSRVVVLVPWRGGDPIREANWRVTEPYLAAFGWPIHLGDREGPWSRAAACNQAAKDAGMWDVAVIADADTVPETASVLAAVEIAAETGGGVRPHDHLWRLTRSGTAVLKKWGPKVVNRRQTTGTFPGGGLLVVSRSGFDAVGGYDERFVGWGSEDSVLNTRLLVEAHWDRIPGNAWHLWHPADPKDTPERAANRRMMQAVQERHGPAIDRISRERGFDLRGVL